MNKLVLSKRLKLHQLFTIGFGSIVGVGWLMLAGSWLETAGSLGAIIAFATGALAIVTIGLCYGEVGMLFPESGGEVVYAYEGFGTAVSFAMGWFLALVFVAACAFEAVSTAWIISVIFPGIDGLVLYVFLGAEVTLPSLLIGLGGMAFLTWLNARGAYFAARFQDYVIYLFLCAAVMFVFAGIFGGTVENARPLFVTSDSGSAWTGVLAVLATVPAWYGGFNAMLQGLGEVQDTGAPKVFTRILLATLAAAGLFYIGVILAIALAVPREQLLAADMPVAAAFFSAFDITFLGYSVLIAGLLGIITTWNAMLFAGARVLFCLGRARVLPTFFATVHSQYGSPSAAVWFVGACAALGSLAGRNALEPIIQLVSICFSFAYLIVSLSLLRLRKERPELDRPYAVPAYPLIPWMAVVFSALFLLLAVLNIFQSSRTAVPIELAVLGGWALLGFLGWRNARGVRNSIDEDQRRKLIHAR